MRAKIILSLVLLLVTSCSIGPRSYSYGFNNNPAIVGLNETPNGSFAAQSKRNRKKNVTNARLNRPRYRQANLSNGPYDKSRQYTQTRLEIDKVLTAINSYRRKYGLKPVRLDALLTKAAKAHSRDLAKWDRISHFGSDGSNPWDRVKQAGYHARLAAENVGTGQMAFEEVIADWKKSSSHNKNLLLREAEHIGVALVYAPKTEFRTFWTLVIGAPL